MSGASDQKPASQEKRCLTRHDIQALLGKEPPAPGQRYQEELRAAWRGWEERLVDLAPWPPLAGGLIALVAASLPPDVLWRGLLLRAGLLLLATGLLLTTAALLLGNLNPVEPPRRLLRDADTGGREPRGWPWPRLRADGSGLYLEGVSPRWVDWWQIEAVAEDGEDWLVQTAHGPFRFNPRHPCHQAVAQALLEVLSARERGFRLPDEPVEPG